ncbi:MAG: hypothetical protein ACUVQW_06605, partial [Candidatus Bathycorpusculaceae bacterium]
SHNVEEAVFMADRVIVMSPRPGKVVGEVKVEIPRPRENHLRDSAYFSLVDKVVEMLEESKAIAKNESPLSLTANRTNKT